MVAEEVHVGVEAGALGGAAVHEVLEVLAIHLHQIRDSSCQGRHAVPRFFNVLCSAKLRTGQSGGLPWNFCCNTPSFPGWYGTALWVSDEVTHLCADAGHRQHQLVLGPRIAPSAAERVLVVMLAGGDFCMLVLHHPNNACTKASNQAEACTEQQLLRFLPVVCS